MWFVYILHCLDNSYYTGITTNLEKRLIKHQSGRGGAYTQSHPPVKIIYSEQFPNRSQALRRESQVKKLTRIQKMALVDGKI